MPVPQFPAAFAELLMLFAIAAAAATVVIHIMFTIGVAMDARERERAGVRTELVGGITWCLATLLGGVFVGAIYWAMHRSTLSRRADA